MPMITNTVIRHQTNNTTSVVIVVQDKVCFVRFCAGFARFRA